MTYHLALFIIIILLALTAVMAKNMIFSIVLLASLSIGISLILFTFTSPWAAVFELSVCAGLITVLFISVINLMPPKKRELQESRLKFNLLPLALLIVAVLGWIYIIPLFETLSKYPHLNIHNYPLGQIIWKDRIFDLIGQICVFAAGALAIKSFFYKAKGTKKH
ncbi:MAG: NADH-quinone oxidoreductase subunit J [Elusimicrobiota bacterium]|nr:NADH-quinone oxidoreductase subunit J [Elusimicrobiota bacterium]